jgi:hypothetical protein
MRDVAMKHCFLQFVSPEGMTLLSRWNMFYDASEIIPSSFVAIYSERIDSRHPLNSGDQSRNLWQRERERERERERGSWIEGGLHV